MKQAKFPSDISKGTTDDRVNYFNEFMIRHPLFDAAFTEIVDAVMSREKEPLIFTFGPSGVGKTTLKKALEKKLVAEAIPELKTDEEMIPVVSIEAVAAGIGNFRWNDYYTRALSALKEPLIDKKVIYADEKGLTKGQSRGSTAALRRALEKTLKYRRPTAFIIDEAQHLSKIAHKSKLGEQLDCIKSLSNLTGVKHVLFGTYDLLNFRNKSAQLNNRSKDIQFRRYDARKAEDRQIFRNIIGTFELYMPLPEVPDLVQHAAFLMERSVGCVGTLKLWLARALRLALNDGSGSVLEKHLKATAPSIEKALTMAEEAIAGETALIDDEKKRTKLLLLLGMAIESHEPDNEKIKAAKKFIKFKPGKPKAKRMPVGWTGAETGAEAEKISLDYCDKVAVPQ